ncbi:MAG: DUF3667 domain-containing protein [Candidatus Eisenbacteria bacterium]
MARHRIHPACWNEAGDAATVAAHAGGLAGSSGKVHYASMPRRLPKVTACQNCGTPVMGNYCPNCGQDCRDHAVSLRVLAGDLWAVLFTLDSRLIRTIIPLLFKPGELPLEYIRGRRARYVPPLRLFLFITLLLFFSITIRVNPIFDKSHDPSETPADSTAIAAAITNLEHLPAAVRSDRSDQLRLELLAALDQARAAADSSSASAADTAAGDDGDSAAGDLDSADDDGDSTASGGPVIRLGSLRNTTVMGQDITGSENRVIRGAFKLAPKMVFCLLPLFAALLALIYLRARRMFVEHLVFSLYYHAAFFLGFAIAALTNSQTAVLMIPPLGGLYLLLAMKRVYRQGWPKTLAKHFLLVSGYTLIFLFFMAIVMGSSAYLFQLAQQHRWILSLLGG